MELNVCPFHAKMETVSIFRKQKQKSSELKRKLCPGKRYIVGIAVSAGNRNTAGISVYVTVCLAHPQLAKGPSTITLNSFPV